MVSLFWVAIWLMSGHPEIHFWDVWSVTGLMALAVDFLIFAIFDD